MADFKECSLLLGLANYKQEAGTKKQKTTKEDKS
jgi:hypothetical protein